MDPEETTPPEATLRVVTEEEDSPPAERKTQFGGNAFQGGFGHYMQEKIRKLNEQLKQDVAAEQAPKDPAIFHGINVYVTGHTVPSFQDLRMLVGKHGGDFSQYYSASEVTHVIAMNLSNSKAKDFKNQKVVRPSWITESVKAGKLLPWRSFELRLDVPGANSLLISAFVPVENKITRHLSSATGVMAAVTTTTTATAATPTTATTLSSNVSTENSPNKSKWIRENSSIAPDFVSKFFQSSRLHYLSSWKNELRQYSFCKTENNASGSLGRQRCILHIDMDCFFASVALRDRPHLRQQAIGISHGSGEGASRSSDVASCNYVAREKGVRNGMHIGRAKELCPELVILPYEFEKYKEASRRLYAVLMPLADSLLACSCDEAFLDISSYVTVDPSNSNRRIELEYNDNQTDMVTPSRGIQTDCLSLVSYIHREIFQLTGCTASIGVGPNILLARLSTRSAKPSGMYMCDQSGPNDEVLAFLDPLPVDALPGIGWSIRDKMEEHFQRENIVCKDVRQQFSSVDALQQVLGKKLGERVFQFVRGVDDRPVMAADADEDFAVRKTIGADINWGIRFEREDQFRRFLMDLCKEVTSRLTDPNGFPPPGMTTATNTTATTTAATTTTTTTKTTITTNAQHPEHARWVAGALTLKLRVRHPDAPVEPAKHLGCGQCNSFSHSVPVQPASARAEALFQAASAAMHQLKRRICGSGGGGGGGGSASGSSNGTGSWRWEDLRGVGITTSKLTFSEDGSGRSSGTELGGFQQSSISTLFQKQAAQKEEGFPTAAAGMKAPTKTNDDHQDLFRLSQLDPFVLQELPEEIRQEIQAAIQDRTRLAPSPTAPRTPSKSTTPPLKQRARNSPSNLLHGGSPSTPTKITQYWTSKNDGGGDDNDDDDDDAAPISGTPMRLPNGDVVDPDSWNHLPSSLKREILEDVQNQKRRQVMSPNKMTFERAKIRRKEEPRRNNPTADKNFPIPKSNLSNSNNIITSNSSKNSGNIAKKTSTLATTSIVLAPLGHEHLVLAGDWHAVQEELDFWLQRFDSNVEAFQQDVQQLRSHLMDLVNELQLERAEQVLRLISRRADGRQALQTLKQGLVKEIREAIAMRVQL